jgi:hypothetical protein
MTRFARLDWDRLSWLIAIEVGVVTSLAAYFLPGGEDLHRYYIPFSQGCLDCGFVPYFAQWILWPLGLVPPRLAWPLWTAATAGGILALCRHTKVNPAVVMLSFPAMGQIWLGQIDLIVAVGLALSLLARHPYVRGAGIILALTKPQIAGLAVLVLLIHLSPQETIQTLLIPVAAVALSFLVYGLRWPIEWLTNSLSDLPAHVWRLAARDVWPFGLVSLVSVPFLPRLRSRFEAGLLASALASPFMGVYSYVVFLVFYAPWWSLPLSYAWALLYPIWGKAAMRVAWLLPAALLGWMVCSGRDTPSTGRTSRSGSAQDPERAAGAE